MRRIVSLLLALAVMLGLAACGAATAVPATATPGAAAIQTEISGQFRVGMECAYAPNNWQEAAATDTNVPIENVPGAYAQGYDVQIARAVADYLGYELIVVKLSWEGLIEALNQGRIDAIIAGMMSTAERRQAINFSDPYQNGEYGIMVMSGSPYENARSIHDFSGASVLGQKDTMYDEVIGQMDGVNHLPPVSSVPDMLSRLEEGTCDAVVVDVISTQAYLKVNPNFVVISFAAGSGFVMEDSSARIGLRKSDTRLLAAVNGALATLDDTTRGTLWSTAIDNQPA